MPQAVDFIKRQRTADELKKQENRKIISKMPAITTAIESCVISPEKGALNDNEIRSILQVEKA